MSPLSDAQLKAAVADGDLAVEPFDEDNVEPASLDLALGEEAFVASEDEKTRLDDGDVLTLPPGEMVLVLTREHLDLGPQLAGTIGLRSHFSRKGVDLLAGPQVDPGFEGPLHIVLVNLSPSRIVVEYGEPFLTVEFRRLSEPVDEAYAGTYQASDSITTEEMRDLKEGDGVPLSEAVRAMQAIAKDVATLEDNISNLTRQVDRYMRIFASSLVVLVAAIVTAILSFVLTIL